MSEQQAEAQPEWGNESADKRAVEELMHAVGLIPAAKKAAFLRAMREVPSLVESESNPIWFLKLDNYNYWKAAERLVQHWSEREALFGERVHLPLTQTGNGALTSEDVMSLHTGTYSILPKSPSGQSVFFMDRGRALANATPESRLRAAFYVMAFLSKEENSQSEGILALSLLVSPRVQGLDHGYEHRIYRLMNTFPLKIHLHLLNCLPKTGKHALVQQVMTSGFAFASMYFGGFQVFTEKSGTDMLARLTELGLTADGVPVSVGGTWTYENFTRWCRERITAEQTLDHLHRRRVDQSAAITAQDEESRRERMRTLNVIHSRQKRERRKAEQRELKEECEKLQNKNRLLKEDNKKLKALLTSAQQIEQAIVDGRIQENNFVPEDNLKKPAATTIKPMATGTPPAVDILQMLTQNQRQPQPMDLQSTFQSLMNQPPEVQALALFVLQNGLQPNQQQAAPTPALLQNKPASAPQQQQQQQQPFDHGTLTQVLMSSIGQVRTTQTQAQAPDMDLSKLIQVLVPSLNQTSDNNMSNGGGVQSNYMTSPSASAQSNVASSGAALSTGGTDSLVTLVTLLLLQAQQQI
mmetsp:Transcript_11911/g.22785  ORF Transcript_11911/g.22785 Transcript_11911/m.22785 type:complete len:582 (-) Transcript_11911:161-1906(-)|eukprot:scaffold34685_cov183-Amphora_coffeaeformis.AAC.24